MQVLPGVQKICPSSLPSLPEVLVSMSLSAAFSRRHGPRLQFAGIIASAAFPLAARGEKKPSLPEIPSAPPASLALSAPSPSQPKPSHL